MSDAAKFQVGGWLRFCCHSGLPRPLRRAGQQEPEPDDEEEEEE